MREFFILIGELLFIALMQTIAETILDSEKREKQVAVVNMACILVSYFLLLRFVYTHLMGAYTTLVGFPFV